MTATINLGDLGIGTLTDEHATCSYGQVVLIVHGQTYGPCDMLGPDQAGAVVNSARMEQWEDFGSSTDDGPMLARRFVHAGLRMPQCNAVSSIAEAVSKRLA